VGSACNRFLQIASTPYDDGPLIECPPRFTLRACANTYG